MDPVPYDIMDIRSFTIKKRYGRTNFEWMKVLLANSNDF